MVYIALTLVGIVAVIATKRIWNQNIQIIFILLTLIIGLSLFLFIDLFIIEPIDVTSKGATWWSNIPWLEISIYFIMLLGMAAKYFYDSIGENKRIKFKKWQFIRPMLVSPIVFGTIYGKVGDSTPVSLLLIFAFQNGFFWHTVLIRK